MTDLDRLCERLAERLALEGATHPDVAAVALVVRGVTGLEVEEFALMTAVPAGELLAGESGELAWNELPPEVRDRAVSCERLDLSRALVGSSSLPDGDASAISRRGAGD